MPRRTTIRATPSDFPKIDLAGRYLELMRLRESVQKAERERDPPLKCKLSTTTLHTRIAICRRYRRLRMDH